MTKRDFPLTTEIYVCFQTESSERQEKKTFNSPLKYQENLWTIVQRLDIMILGVTGMGKDAFEMHIVAWG